MPRTSKAKITPTEVELHRIEAENALARLHGRQKDENAARLEWRDCVNERTKAEKAYAAAVRRWKLAEAKLPPPKSTAETIREILAEPYTNADNQMAMFVDGEPVEV